MPTVVILFIALHYECRHLYLAHSRPFLQLIAMVCVWRTCETFKGLAAAPFRCLNTSSKYVHATTGI